MARLTFNQVFFGLMGLSFISAFLLPPRISDVPRQHLETLFVPVSHPTLRLANWIRGNVAPPDAPDSRPSQTIEQENKDLRIQVLHLQAEVVRLGGVEAERESLGKIRGYCDRLSVQGVDSGNLQGFILGGMIDGVKIGQAVLYPGGLAGVVVNANHVRLITDPGFVISGKFKRLVKDDAGHMNFEDVSGLNPAIVIGSGNEQMKITNLTFNDIQQKLHEGDLVVLSGADTAFSPYLSGEPLGRIISIGRLAQQPQFAEIHVKPETSLMHLNDVWVMTRQP